MLFSVPISSLQIWGRDEQWYFVPYKPGALVINIGETLERLYTLTLRKLFCIDGSSGIRRPFSSNKTPCS